jgi:hypothetical protein
LVRRVLLKGIVNPILMVVVHVIADEPSKMGLTECDDMIEKLPATASDPAFRDSVLPRRLNAGTLRLQPVDFRNPITSALNLESRSRMT